MTQAPQKRKLGRTARWPIPLRAAASKIGTSTTNLYYVLTGQRQSPRLEAAYRTLCEQQTGVSNKGKR